MEAGLAHHMWTIEELVAIRGMRAWRHGKEEKI
jgi:hypothetical protein